MSNSDITQYDWVSFFNSICEEINTLASDATTREQKLLEKAEMIFLAEHNLLKYKRIDPFSFLYALAQRNTVNQKNPIFTNVKNSFEIKVNIPTDWNFPTPTPNTPSSFYNAGKYVNRLGENIGNDCLWNLFDQCYNNLILDENALKIALSLKNVGFTKISQVLFLINPKKYIPFDTQMNSLPIPQLTNLSQVVPRIETEGVKVYFDAIEALKKAFKGCELYEINLLNVLINAYSNDRLEVSNRYCQVSSWVYGDNDKDYFDSFVSENAVWTGGETSSGGKRTYPVTKYQRGDIVLVRRGRKRLGGVAIILKNDYIPNGFDEDKSIKIIWLTKEEKRIEEDALGQWDGFSQASDKTLQKFKEAYPITFQILDEIRKKQGTIMVNHSLVKYKNFILQGPPGTGKTRLAKQIAIWLTNETNKSLTLIEAIDQNSFEHETDIENNDQVKLIQFHPSYTYEDFVRGIKTEVEHDKVKYVVENKILTKLAEEAAKTDNQHKAYVLIIDEINRANLSSVLGELIYALEYRGQTVNSMYAYENSNTVSLPHNLYIIGTMNTADRSVSSIDYAIRRRFTFVPVLSDKTAIIHEKAKNLFNTIVSIFDNHTSPEFDKNDIQIGHSYFLHADSDMPMKLKYEIKPLLLEYIKDGVLLQTAKEIIDKLHV